MAKEETNYRSNQFFVRLGNGVIDDIGRKCVEGEMEYLDLAVLTRIVSYRCLDADSEKGKRFSKQTKKTLIEFFKISEPRMRRCLHRLAEHQFISLIPAYFKNGRKVKKLRIKINPIVFPLPKKYRQK